jgi:threonine/homoserine/homoserine lactone efflux protein
MVAGAIGLVMATSIPQALANVVVVAASTYLFWRMVRALARVQKMTREPASGDG